jgi:hypothetical protein
MQTQPNHSMPIGHKNSIGNSCHNMRAATVEFMTSTVLLNAQQKTVENGSVTPKV